jgi:hypothetical protein
MDHVAKALIIDLASGPVGTAWNPTEEQQLLGIPSQLIFLAGLVLHGKRSTAPPYPSSVQERFVQLQALYNAQVNVIIPLNTKTFHLSPRLAPTAEQQKVIQQEISRTFQELEGKANAVLQDLLTTADKPTKHNRSSKQKAKKTAPPQKASFSHLSHLDEEANEDRISAEPLEEVMMALHIPTDQDGSIVKDGSWLPVPKKKASKPHHETANENEKENDNENQSAAQEATHHHHSPNNRMEETPNLRTATSQDSGSTASSGISYLAAAQQPPKTWVATPDEISLPQIKDESDHNNTSSSSSSSPLEQRVRQLERQLAQTNQQWQAERQAHTKRLRCEKERSDTILQAVQLRLYISETRLKTYQDALEEHVQAVGENVYTPSSPPRRRRVEQNETASPLISRVLIQQKRIEE